MDWSDVELRATVRAYLDMLAAQQAGQQYSKADYRRALRQGLLKARSEPSIEYRMRNISAVMDRHRLPIVKGYLPAKNVGDAVAARLWSMIGEVRAAPSSVEVSRLQPKAASRPPIVYFNIGWMKHYSGTPVDDPTIGGFGFLADNKHGAEAFNFLPNADGYVRGYRPGHARKLNLARLGAAPGADRLEGVLVVWMARDPASKRTMIVGWYENATVFETAQPGELALEGTKWPFNVEANASDAHLVPVLARNFRIHSARTEEGGFGQSPTWYGSDAINERVWNYVRKVKAGIAKKPTGGKSPPRNTDPELRRKVERAAVEHATAFYQSEHGGRCEVVSVEALGKGWDLEVWNGELDLLVEVKGLLGSTLSCELTPNEYRKMTAKAHCDRYVVYVVTNALEGPIATIFRRNGHGKWQTDDGRTLQIEERMSAVLSCG